MPKAKTVLVLSIKEAIEFGLILCSCGHPPNNHFEHGTRPCAHCSCKEYEMTARRGHLEERIR